MSGVMGCCLSLFQKEKKKKLWRLWCGLLDLWKQESECLFHLRNLYGLDSSRWNWCWWIKWSEGEKWEKGKGENRLVFLKWRCFSSQQLIYWKSQVTKRNLETQVKSHGNTGRNPREMNEPDTWKNNKLSYFWLKILLEEQKSCLKSGLIFGTSLWFFPFHIVSPQYLSEILYSCYFPLVINVFTVRATLDPYHLFSRLNLQIYLAS